MTKKEGDHKNHIQAVHKALVLVDLLAKEKREMALTEIAQKTGWPKSTVHGLLSTLRDFDYVQQSAASGRYWLGTRLFELGNLVARTWDISQVARPAMLRLNELLGEMVQLATEQDGEVLYLEKIDSTHLLRIVSEVGTRLPMHCTGLGKVLLAYKSTAERKWIYANKPLTPLTSRTIVSVPQLEKELSKIRDQGYSTDDGEVMEGLRCVAAPIRGADGKVKYAISVSSTYNHMEGAKYEKTTQLVIRAAASISNRLGYRDVETLTDEF